MRIASAPIDMSPPPAEGDGLENPLRAIIVVNSPSVPDGDMDERMLDTVQTFDEVEAFFDEFDAKVAEPNKDHIKYEVGSDGLVVFVVDSAALKATVLKFIDAFTDSVADKEEDVVKPVQKRAKPEQAESGKETPGETAEEKGE